MFYNNFNFYYVFASVLISDLWIFNKLGNWFQLVCCWHVINFQLENCFYSIHAGVIKLPNKYIWNVNAWKMIDQYKVCKKDF